MTNVLDELTKSPLWEWLVKNLGSFHFRTKGYPLFPIADFFKIVDMFTPNCIYLFACSDYETVGSFITRFMTNDIFTHAGFITPGEGYNDVCAFHIRTTGITCTHLLSLLKEVDYLAVSKIQLTPEDYKLVTQKILDILKNKEQYQYDFEERLGNGNHKMYCSELIYTTLESTVKLKTEMTLGRESFLPDQAVKSGSIIYSNHPDLKAAA